MSQAVLGIDIAKSKFDVALRDEGKFKTKVFANAPTGFAALGRWLTAHGVSRVEACMEATNTYGQALAEYLFDAGHTVSVVNPAQIKAFAQSQLRRTKTDAVDAKLIAEFGYHFHPKPWTPLPASARALRALVRRVESVQDMRQQERNRLETAEPSIRADLRAHLTQLNRRLVQLRARLHQHLDRDPELRQQRDLLRTIPGIGEATLAAILASVPEPQGFGSAKQLAAFAGLTPRQRHSGSSVNGRTVLAKTGEARLRAALFMPTLVAIRYNPLIRAFYLRLRQAGKNGKAAVCAAMRKLLHIIYGVLKHRQPFDPKWGTC